MLGSEKFCFSNNKRKLHEAWLYDNEYKTRLMNMKHDWRIRSTTDGYKARLNFCHPNSFLEISLKNVTLINFVVQLVEQEFYCLICIVDYCWDKKKRNILYRTRTSSSSHSSTVRLSLNFFYTLQRSTITRWYSRCFQRIGFLMTCAFNDRLQSCASIFCIE